MNTVPALEHLNDSEFELMIKAPVLVCILVAGADGHVDNKEINGALSIISKVYKSGSSLASYFSFLSEDFEDKIKITLQNYPHDVKRRTEIIVSELASLNSILPSLDKEFAKGFYQFLMELARKTASSSGGLLGINAIGPEEEKFINLAMINSPQ